MRSFIVFTCLVAVCLSVPFSPAQQRKRVASQRKRSVDVLSLAVKSTFSKHQIKRYTLEDGIKDAFNMIDSNKNGHISGSEFAGFYSNPTHIRLYNLDAEGLGDTSYSEWKAMFDLVAPLIDNNGSPNTIELDEFRFLSELGMGRKK